MNSETARVKAKSKLILWWVLFVFFVAAGGFCEYLRHTQPLDETLVLYKPAGEENESGGVTENIQPEQVKNSEQLPSIKNEQAEEIKEVTSQNVSEMVEPEPEFEALQEFLIYMLESQQFLDDDAHHVTVLERIKQEENTVVSEPKKEDVKFEENKIEVYDSEKGVVDVIEVPVPAEKVSEMFEETTAEEGTEHQASQTEELDLVQDEIKNVEDKMQKAAMDAENIMRENVQAEIQRVEETGDEAPIVLIPGLQNM